MRLIFFMFLLPISFFGQTKKVDIWKQNDLEQAIEKSNSKLKLYHFWATWCVPCVRELPVYKKVSNHYEDQVEIVLVSLDFKDQLKERLLPFIEKHQLKLPVVLLDLDDENNWINSIDKQWQGNLPASLIVYNEQKYFYPKGFELEELKTTINNLLKL